MKRAQMPREQDCTVRSSDPHLFLQVKVGYMAPMVAVVEAVGDGWVNISTLNIYVSNTRALKFGK